LDKKIVELKIKVTKTKIKAKLMSSYILIF